MKRLALELPAPFLAEPEPPADLRVALLTRATEAVASFHHLSVTRRQQAQHLSYRASLLTRDRALRRIDRVLISDDLAKLHRVLADRLVQRRRHASPGAKLADGPVELERQPAPLEIGVYYVVSEALTNAAKHSGASEISIRVVAEADRIRATISDDGVGGADRNAGSGLTGLIDRVAALGGKVEIDSRPAAGTTISAVVPIRGGER
jgi:glucose-6-phosphate-specific signal transduction histidine kinase